MNEAVQIIPEGALEQLGANLAAYEKVSGRTGAAVLKQKAAQILFGNSNPKFGAVFPGLVELFKDQEPRPGAITEAARVRGWRMGRRGSNQIAGISNTARDRALEKMGGFKTIWAMVSSVGGHLMISPLLIGKSGKRVHGGRKFSSRRTGRVVSGAIDDVSVVQEARAQGAVRLNFRALATAEEVNVREQGRGFLGAGWLFNRWRRLAQADPLNPQEQINRLENMNPRSTLGLLGEAEMTGDEDKGNVEIRLTSFVPGTEDVGRSRSIFSRVIDSVNADIATYLANKEREALVNFLKDPLSIARV
jgi:hypothetical protein